MCRPLSTIVQRTGLLPALVCLAAACSVATPPPSRELVQPPSVVASAEAPKLATAPLPVLRVGVSGDYAPFSTRDAAGAPRGFDIEIAAALARELGFEPSWVTFRWPELTRQLSVGAFDVAMSGITWQPARDVEGYMTRAVARGGPCLLGDAASLRIAVNRGGILESWARTHLGDRELVTVDDNQSLPQLLSEGRVGAIVTDSFELREFARPGWGRRCEPALARKVYWVAPGAPGGLGERIDAWLSMHTERVQAAQERWIGERQRLDASTHLVDLMARRFAFMPLVAALKAERGQPIEDPAREREVLTAVAAGARRQGLPERATTELFTLQIELSKAVQRRQREPSALDLGKHIRPALTALGDRILAALAEARREARLSTLEPADLELLSPWLASDERERLRLALVAVATP